MARIRSEDVTITADTQPAPGYREGTPHVPRIVDNVALREKSARVDSNSTVRTYSTPTEFADAARTGGPNIVVDLGITVAAIAAVFGASVAAAHFGSVPQPLRWTFWAGVLIGVVAYPIVAGIEHLMPPAGPRKSLRNWLMHYQLNMLLIVSFAAAGALSALAITALSHRYHLGLIDLRIASGRGASSVIGAFVLSTFIYDFFYYWYHRSLHTFPVLWQIHKLHHMDLQMDVVTVGRQNWIEGFTHTLFAITLPALLFRLDSLTLFEAGLTGAAIAVFLSCWGPFFHANVKLYLGKAAILLQAPQLHRIHHSRLPQHQDKNFANYFPILDWLFDTFYCPTRDEYPPTGVEGEKEIDSLLEAELLTLRSWWRMFCGWRARRALAAH